MDTIIAFAADADMLCPRHAVAAYPRCDDLQQTVTDKSGNEVRPLFLGDAADVAVWERYGCAECRRPLPGYGLVSGPAR